MSYALFARELVASGVVLDPWCGGAPRFREEPIVLSRIDAVAHFRVAEAVASLVDEGVRLVTADPSLLETYFHMPPWLRSLARAALPRWHVMARADVFRTTDGRLVVCEMNSDTPTGQAEAVLLGALAQAQRPGTEDPAARLEPRFLRVLDALRRTLSPRAPRAVGLVYPTEMTDDLPLVRLYRGWLEGAGLPVMLGSPFNLARDADGALCMLEEPVGLVLRHYKADWWAERVPTFLGEAPPDDDVPLRPAIAAVVGAGVDTRALVVNPFGAALSQNKRLFAFLWEARHRLSPSSRRTLETHVPYTVRLESLDAAALRAERDAWVLKSAYGCEGEEVLVGRLLPDELWARALTFARPGQWVAQRRFDAVVDAAGETVNMGVFVLGGEAVAFYARAEVGPTSPAALSVPVLVEP